MVTAGAVRLLWSLEDRGVAVRLDERDGALLVGPRGRLTDADRRAIRAYRDELRELVQHRPLGVQ